MHCDMMEYDISSSDAICHTMQDDTVQYWAM